MRWATGIVQTIPSADVRTPHNPISRPLFFPPLGAGHRASVPGPFIKASISLQSVSIGAVCTGQHCGGQDGAGYQRRPVNPTRMRDQINTRDNYGPNGRQV